MSSSLSGIDISGLQLQDDFDIGISSVSEEAIAGNLIIFEKDKNYKDLLLMGGDSWGYLKYSILAQLKALASVKQSEYVLIYEGTSYDVRFKIEDFPAIAGSPIGNPVAITDETYFNNIVIKLVEV